METSPFYIYSNPITPSEAAAALEAVNILDSSKGANLIDTVRGLAARLRAGLTERGYETIAGEHPIVPLLVRDTARTRELAGRLFDRNILATDLSLDLLVDQNGASLLRVVRDPMDWVSSESLIPALHNLDPTTLSQVYEAPAMQDIWNTIGYLNQKGLKGEQLVLNFMGWTPGWMGGSGDYGTISTITAGKEGAFATMVASLVYYGRYVKGLDFKLLSPMNEQDWDGLEGPKVSASQYVTILSALVAELDAMGLGDVRIAGRTPRTTTRATSRP